jgi:hypothetical protein
LSDSFPIQNGLKQGDALSPQLFNFAVEYAIRKNQVNQTRLKLNGTHQLLAYADDVNLLGDNIDTVNKNTENVAIFWDIALCSKYVNRHFGGTTTCIFRVEYQPSKKPTCSRLQGKMLVDLFLG